MAAISRGLSATPATDIFSDTELNFITLGDGVVFSRVLISYSFLYFLYYISIDMRTLVNTLGDTRFIGGGDDLFRRVQTKIKFVTNHTFTTVWALSFFIVVVK